MASTDTWFFFCRSDQPTFDASEIIADRYFLLRQNNFAQTRIEISKKKKT